MVIKDSLKIRRGLRPFLHLVSISFICFLIVFNFFEVKKITAYPWWHSHGNDTDAVNAATTIGLLNGLGFAHIYHPGATIYHYDAIAYRLLALFHKPHQELFRLGQARTKDQVSDLLETGTRTSRVVVLIMAVAFTGILYVIFYLFTASISLSFFATFFVMTSQALSWHTYWVRPDLPCLLFFLCAVGVAMTQFSSSPISNRRLLTASLGIGFLIGFSLFSKLQGATFIFVFIGYVLFYLITKTRDGFVAGNKPAVRSVFVLAVFNLVLMPWWVLRRPDFLTRQYLDSFVTVTDLRKVYGAAPENFIFPVLVPFILITLVAGGWAILRECKRAEKVITGFFPVIAFIVLFCTGLIVSIYVIFLPACPTFASYYQNTQHLVYAMFTNIAYSPYMARPHINLETLREIYSLHGAVSLFLNVNLLIFVFLTAGLSALRLFVWRPQDRASYRYMLLFFGLGFLIDIFSSLRGVHPYIYSYYGIYSIVFYVLGMMCFLAAEFRLSKGQAARYPKIIKAIVLVSMVAHMGWVSFYLFTQPRATGVTDQYPLPEYMNTWGHAGPFWEFVDRCQNEGAC